MQEWKVGEVVVRAAVEVAMPLPAAGLVVEINADSVAEDLHWLQPAYLDADYNINLAVQSFLVESAGRRILVDTCFGHGHQLPYDLPIEPRLPRDARRGGVRSPGGRRRRVHAPALRPRRLERDPGRRSVGADVPECPVPVRQHRVRPLERGSGPEFGATRRACNCSSTAG